MFMFYNLYFFLRMLLLLFIKAIVLLTSIYDCFTVYKSLLYKLILITEARIDKYYRVILFTKLLLLNGKPLLVPYVIDFIP